jgi:hypothetical protein
MDGMGCGQHIGLAAKDCVMARKVCFSIAAIVFAFGLTA